MGYSKFRFDVEVKKPNALERGELSTYRKSRKDSLWSPYLAELYLQDEYIARFDKRYADPDNRREKRLILHPRVVQLLTDYAEICQDKRQAKESGYAITRGEVKLLAWDIISAADGDLDLACRGFRYLVSYPRTKDMHKIRQAMGLEKKKYTRFYSDDPAKPKGRNDLPKLPGIIELERRRTDPSMTMAFIAGETVIPFAAQHEVDIPVALLNAWLVESAQFIRTGKFHLDNGHRSLGGNDVLIHLACKVIEWNAIKTDINLFRYNTWAFKKYILDILKCEESRYKKAIADYTPF